MSEAQEQPQVYARLAQARRLREAGISRTQVAKIMRLDVETVSSYVSRAKNFEKFTAGQKKWFRNHRPPGVKPRAEYLATVATTGGWTDEREATLKRLWPTAMSAVQIAREIGTTKNAVIGKAHRLGLKPKPRKKRRRKS
jgi:transposase